MVRTREYRAADQTSSRFASIGRDGSLYLVGQQPGQGRLGGAGAAEGPEHMGDRLGDLLVGLQHHCARGIVLVAGGQGQRQFATLGLVALPAIQAVANAVKLEFVDRVLDPLCSAHSYVGQPAEPVVSKGVFLMLPDIILAVQSAFSCSSKPPFAFQRGLSPGSPGQVDFIASSFALRSTSA